MLAYSQTRDRVELTWEQLRDQVRASAGRAGAARRRPGRPGGRRTCPTSRRRWWRSSPPPASARSGRAAPPSSARAAWWTGSGRSSPPCCSPSRATATAARTSTAATQVAEIRAGLPTLRHVVHVPYGPNALPDALGWAELLAEPGELAFEPVPFAHPLCVLFSSGTTGKPKAIVHSPRRDPARTPQEPRPAAGTCAPGDRMLWFSTTAWMMWNALVSGAAGARLAS